MIDATAIVLAGGASSRMGLDKATGLTIDGRPLIEDTVLRLSAVFPHVLVSANDRRRLDFLGVPVVVDELPGLGPLMAITSALRASSTSHNFVIACDIPDPPLDLALDLCQALEGVECVVPRTSTGHLEPLFAAYDKRFLQTADEALRRGRLKLVDVIAATCRYFELSSERELTNLNTRDDLAAHGQIRLKGEDA